MEEKIYDRQVTKQSLSFRVIDQQQIERHFTMNELTELYTFEPDLIDDPNTEKKKKREIPKLPKVRGSVFNGSGSWELGLYCSNCAKVLTVYETVLQNPAVRAFPSSGH